MFLNPVLFRQVTFILFFIIQPYTLNKTVSSASKLKKYMRKRILAHIFASNYLHKMKARRDVYQAIADPTRRKIISMIASKPHNINAIAENFAVSRQAISLQVQILVDCGLI